MLVFVDESGDPGLKIKRGSSDFFTVTLVIFSSNEEAMKADAGIAQLREEMQMHPRSEFKFNKLSKGHRCRLLNTVRAFDFQYFSIVITKAKLTGPGFSYRGSACKYACRLVFNNCRQLLDEATVVIDGSGSREFRRQLQAYLKTRINDVNTTRRRIKKVKTEDSVSNNLLQLADIICGAVARSYSNKTDSNVCRDLVRPREKHVQFWPK